MEDRIKKIKLFIGLFILIYFIGIIGYHLIEKYNFIDSFYMTAITISTVGFSEVAVLSPLGKVFTVILIFFGITVALYGLSSITAFLVEGELQNYLKGVKMTKDIEKLKNHYIICGAGKTGIKIIQEFLKLKEKFVIIENNEENIEGFKLITNEKLLVIKGDSTKEEVLEKAGIKTAKGLIGTLPSDAENVFLTLTARDLNKNIKIVTRAIETHSEKKMKKSGADYIISPLDIAAQRIVSTAVNAGLVDFLDVITNTGSDGLRLELVEILEKSDFNNIMLKDARIPQKTNLIVIGIKSGGNTMINPMSVTILQAGDQLLVLGTEIQIEKIKDLASGKEKDKHIEGNQLNF